MFTSPGRRVPISALCFCLFICGAAILLLGAIGSGATGVASAGYYAPYTAGQLKVSPIGFITGTYEYTPGQTYVLADRQPGDGDPTTAFLDFNGSASSNVDEAWIHCGYNPSVTNVEQWRQWCLDPGYRSESGAVSPTLYWLGDGEPESGPYYDPRLEWGEGVNGWWLRGGLGMYSNVCHEMVEFVLAANGKDYDIPILDSYQDTGGSGTFVHLRVLPRFHIQNSSASCTTLSWHVEGVVLTTPPTETPTETPTRTPTRSPTAVPTATSTPTGQSSLVSHVTWQGPPAQPSAGQQLPITLTLCASGAPVVYAATTDADGYFTVTTTLPPGSYKWWVKGPKYLATAGTLALASGTNYAEMGSQLAGDIDSTHDNLDTIKDFTKMRSVLGTSSTEGDLNNDGVTNITDYTLMRSNFGASGDSANCP